ncbi:nucleoside hydrolase [Psychromonas aquimarina]|uniref:nucleoside hydrolase n=1 Tax=Psychromonas aquimarina TaxID=444919 RepID=UPI0003F933C6|nr:nucleoside hydrolase [Psychromonas aquimarina]
MNGFVKKNGLAGDCLKSALLVVTSHTQLDGCDQKTGFWFEELATPFWGFYDAGFNVRIASIKGGKADADPLSQQKEFSCVSVERFLAAPEAMRLLDDTICIDDVDSREYTTIFLCGGHGTLWDFKESKGLARVAGEFYQAEKLIGSVCHGTTGLLSAKKSNGEPLVKGLKMTSFTDAEEELVPPAYIKALPYHLEDALRKQGANYNLDKPNSRFVVCEKGLITGQNPQSTSLVTKTILDALTKTSVWIDSDLSADRIDNTYAVLNLFNAVSVKIEGISTVFGDTDAETAFKLACELSNRFGPIGLTVAQGADSALQIGLLRETDATRALAEKLKKQKLTIVAAGPATNIAAFALLYPNLVSQIERVILAAGRSSQQSHFIAGPKQTLPFSDRNFDLDSDAFRILLESEIPVVLVPYELADKCLITQKELDLLAGKSGVGQYLQAHSQAYLNKWVTEFGAPGFSPVGALAAGFAVNPNIFTCSTVAAEIKILADDSRNTGYADPTSYKPCLIASEQSVSPNKVLFCHDVEADFSAQMIQRISSPNDPSKFICAVSHLNVIVDDVDKAAAFYQRTLGFEQAYDEEGKMDYPNLTLPSFAKDAGFLDGKVDVDIRFLHHPTAGLYLELMCYHTPQGEQNVSIKNTNDMGGIRHAALEVNDVFEAFEYLKEQPGVELLHYPKSKREDEEAAPPMMLNPFPVAFFYWRDPYGVQWEMEGGRKRGYLRGI